MIRSNKRKDTLSFIPNNERLFQTMRQKTRKHLRKNLEKLDIFEVQNINGMIQDVVFLC